jgi:penicillin-binding protein 1A
VSKSKIFTQYLNSIYFGNGAYGVESAARTYFGNEPDH